MYYLLKVYARLIIHLFCRKIVVTKSGERETERERRSATSALRSGPRSPLQGPILFAANHPNSFLDGIILTTLLDEPLYSLARGDVFKNKRVAKILRYLKLLPVYRTSEGVQNLEHNYITFAACIEKFREGGIVLIFSEGRCENEWHLRPLKKGTARLALEAWRQGIDLKVIPLGFNYSSFKSYGKEVHLNFGNEVKREMVTGINEGSQIRSFNEQLESELQELVYEIEPGNENKRRRYFPPLPQWKRILFFPFAIVGMIVHFPLWAGATFYTNNRFRKSGHYDSVQTALMVLLYPVYILILGALISWWAVLVLPVLAWFAIRLEFR